MLMRSKKFSVAFLIFLGAFLFFSTVDVQAATRTCEYKIKMWCDDSWSDPENSICDATLTLDSNLNGEIKDIIQNHNKWKEVYFGGRYTFDGETNLSGADFENGCPDIYVVSTNGGLGYTHVIVKKEFPGDFSEENYSKPEKHSGRDTSVDACSSAEISNVTKKYDDKFTSVKAILDRLEEQSTNATPDNVQIGRDLSSVEQSLSELSEWYDSDRKLYFDCRETEEWKNYFDTGGTYDQEYSDTTKRLEDINTNLINNENVSNENKNASAELSDLVSELYRQYNSALGSGEKLPIDCGLLDPELVSTIQQIFDIVRLIVPIILILFGSMDFGKAVIANDQDALKKAASSFLKRAVAAVIIFFLPAIIRYLLTLPGLDGLVSDDPLCQIR